MQYGRDIDQNVKNRTFQSLCESHCTLKLVILQGLVVLQLYSKHLQVGSVPFCVLSISFSNADPFSVGIPCRRVSFRCISFGCVQR